MTLQAVLTALCLWCASTGATLAADQHRGDECFRSEHQLREAGISGHVRHHKTPNGVCYHVGPPNHSGIFSDTKPLTPKVGSTSVKQTEKQTEWKSGYHKPDARSLYMNETADWFEHGYRFYMGWQKSTN